MAEGPIPKLDLGECDREPIHVPGAIQPHGALLALDSDLRIRRYAGDLQALLGWSGDPIGRPASEMLDLRGLSLASSARQAEYLGIVDGNPEPLDLFVHCSGDELIVELEPAPADRRTGAQVLRDLLPAVTAIAAATDMAAAWDAAAAAVRRITGYDRAMIYRFLEDESGQVVAESRAEECDSFLNHRYPASDIPQQARALYLRNPVRLIPDVGYEAAAIKGGDGALDLSGALLRSVSPIHLQYLKNMDVAASASVSLVRDRSLWGLIACHHRTPRPIAHEQREMCRRVALALEQAIARLEEENAQREALRLTRRREELLPLVAGADGVAAGLRANVDELQRVIPADGLCLLLDGELVCSGVTPPEPDTRELARWVLEQAQREPLVTDALSQLYPAAAEWSSKASGLLGCIASRTPLILFLWFRAEEVETVNWAGNPHKAAKPGSPDGQLSPRQSFELWAETVRGRARQWRPNEQDAAQRLATSVAEIGRQKSLAELNRQLVGEVAEKDLLIREVHHRVQNSLQLVTSMLQLQDGDLGGEGAREQLELARDRVLSVALLHRRLWRSQDLENINLEIFFGELVEGLIGTWKEEWRNQVTLDVAPVRLPAHDALLIALIVNELLTNAVKHAYGGGAGPLGLTANEAGMDRISITVSDRGVGTTGESGDESFGSKLVQRLVAKVGGEMRMTSNKPGTAITIEVPIATRR